ncbi:MAG: N-formylglutamate deformylase [Planctomycetota bacterium]|jgi:N-formylglutamate deformylase
MHPTHWSLEKGETPLIALAIHNGHDIREELSHYVSLSDSDRLREEDPHTGVWTSIAPTRAVLQHSRFEVDLNRPRDRAVYRTTEDAWGLAVWNGDGLPDHLVTQSLACYDAFYAGLEELYTEMTATHGRFLVLDLHSYNHRRSGPRGPHADACGNPQVNVGTGTMLDRSRWERVIGRFMDNLSAFPFPGGHLDVRENVKFHGGNCARWTHEVFDASACVLSVEFKKFFMDEWTGWVDERQLHAITDALHVAASGALQELHKP